MALILACCALPGVPLGASAQVGKPLHPNHTASLPRPAPQPVHTTPVPSKPVAPVAAPAARAVVQPDPQSGQFSAAATQLPGQTSAAATGGSHSTQPVQSLVTPGRPGQTQQHLSGWIEAHRNLPLAQQQRALENEPGFRSLTPIEQERIHQRLTQLNAMPPQQRQKVIDRTEAMERLAPPQRQQVRNAMAQLGSLPEDRRHAVSRTFYQLRDMPVAQRQAYMVSPQFHSQFSEQERSAIAGLLTVTPLYPPLQAQAH